MAAQSGVAMFRGVSGRKYSKAIYFDDVAANMVRWDGGQGASATSPLSWTAPEHISLIEVILAAATAQTKTSITRDGIPTGDTLLNALHLASVTFRPQLNIGFRRGRLIGAIQLA